MNINRNFLLWGAIIVSIFVLFNFFQQGTKQVQKRAIPYSEFIQQVNSGQVGQVEIINNEIKGFYRDGKQFETYAPNDPNLIPQLIGSDVLVDVKPPERGISFLYILIQWFPMLLLIGVWIFFMRQMQGGGGKAMGFGKSRAKLLNEKKGKITFDDVAGVEEAKQELEEIVEFLKSPKKFERLGGKIPKGVLLVGPPGTGKTLIARAVAGEAEVPFFTISGSDFVEMFVGVGASRVRDMFEQGRKNAPCIIFIDEIDAVGRHRGAGLGGGNDEREQTLNQMLVEMDGFESQEGIVLIAATNRPDVLDPALLRPGRFDRQVIVPHPDIDGREKILKVHLKKTPLSPDVDPRIIARGTPGFSGADLANLVNEAALLAARRNRKVVAMSELEEAKDKVMMGSERRSLVMGEDERKLTAYHEGGHAIAALHCEASDPIHKATIIPRGQALGMVMRLPEKDHFAYGRDKLEANLVVAMGGRIAEEMIFGADKVTTGASSDIQQATDIARRMVTEWGMSKNLGPLRYNNNEQEVFLGHSVARQQNISEDTARRIDEEVREIVTTAEKVCRAILKKYAGQLEKLAQALLKYETLDGKEIDMILAGKKLTRETVIISETAKKKKAPMSSVPVMPSPKTT